MPVVDEVASVQTRPAARRRATVAVLFTDIVDSTARLVEAGDAGWQDILDAHDHLALVQVRAHHGRVVKSTGDGVLAAFPCAGDAVDAARALGAALIPLSLRIRSAIHLGEVELRADGDLGGLTVHVAARLLATSGVGEVVLSEPAAGALDEASTRIGEVQLKGVPGLWAVYRAGP